MNENNSKTDIFEGEIVTSKSKKPLDIFKTKADKWENNVSKMSDFFEGYIQQMSLVLREQSDVEVMSSFPVADLGIISDVIHQTNIIMRGNIILLPDFDNLPPDIKLKLKKGIYKVGNSKQVDGNMRAVILNEEGIRVKDITLKKVLNNPGNIETIRSIGNQMQMRQIYTKLADIQELQRYQLEKDRDRDIVVPFLDARSLILEAETKENEEERLQLHKEADGKIRKALNAIYADIETTSKRFAKCTRFPFLQFRNQIDTYMEFLTADFQIATKYVGVRLQLLEYMGEVKTAKLVLQQYQYVLYDFLTNPITDKGLSTATLMHDYFHYDKSNMNFWFNFKREITPVLEKSMKALELSVQDENSRDIYIVSVEDIKDETEKE